MKTTLDASLSILDRFLLVVNTRKKAYVLILLWCLCAASYGAFKLFSIETLEYLLIGNKAHPIVHVKKLEAPIVPSF